MLVYDYVRDRLKKDRNFLGVICGPTGSGKSETAIRIAMDLDYRFDVKRQVVFRPSQFMKLLNEGLPKGSAIVFDEAGVGMPARDWHSVSNKMIGYVTQTFRNDNLIVLFTCPAFKYIDSNIRILFHAYMQAESIDYQKKTCTVRFKYLQYNSEIDNLYRKYLTIQNNGERIPVKTFEFRKPPDNVSKTYKRIRAKYTTDLKKQAEDAISMAENPYKAMSQTDIVDCVINKKDKFFQVRAGREYIPLWKIKDYFDVSWHYANVIKGLAESRMERIKK